MQTGVSCESYKEHRNIILSCHIAYAYLFLGGFWKAQLCKASNNWTLTRNLINTPPFDAHCGKNQFWMEINVSTFSCVIITEMEYSNRLTSNLLRSRTSFSIQSLPVGRKKSRSLINWMNDFSRRGSFLGEIIWENRSRIIMLRGLFWKIAQLMFPYLLKVNLVALCGRFLPIKFLCSSQWYFIYFWI